MNTMQERAPDGLYDWIRWCNGAGRQLEESFFQCLKPFGKYLEKKFVTDATKARYYCYFELYDSTKVFCHSGCLNTTSFALEDQLYWGGQQ
jgi:hypothetical protein